MIQLKQIKSTCRPRTAVAYARYSSAGQRDVSIEQQLRDIRAYAEREGYTIVHEYADRARSGFRHVENRTQFQAMIAAASRGSYDTILCWKVDRFGRNRADSATYKSQLASLGISVVYVMEPIPEGAAGFMTEGMLEVLAEWYSRNLSENVKRGMSDNASKCLYNGTTVYGYNGIRNQRYQINEDQAAVVRQIFHLYIDGYSMASIAQQLNDAGQRTESGNTFTFNKVHNILSQERYLGIYKFADYRIPGGMPAIIDQETWEKAQFMKKKTARHYESSPVEYLLTGKAYCGHCGKPLVGDSGTSKSGATFYYYTCQSKKRRAGCSKKSVRKELLEDKVVDFILSRILDESEIEKIADMIIESQKQRASASPIRSMEKELRETERKISNTNRAIAEGVFTSSTITMLRSLEKTAADLRLSIDARRFAEEKIQDRDQVVFFLRGFSHLDRADPHDRKFLIRTFLNAVFVFDDHLLVVGNTSDIPHQVSFSDLPPCSDSDSPKLLRLSHPNTLLILYHVPM